jgi:hypothetical protein
MVKGHVLHLGRDYAASAEAFLEARRQAEAAGDHVHLTHLAGNIGMCWAAQGELARARGCIQEAVELARLQRLPALEASWLVELGKIALREDRTDEAERLARAALQLAGPREHHLTVFRAEWLLHRVRRRLDPRDPDRERSARLQELFVQLDQHEGVEEITEFRESVLRGGSGS